MNQDVLLAVDEELSAARARYPTKQGMSLRSSVIDALAARFGIDLDIAAAAYDEGVAYTTKKASVVPCKAGPRVQAHTAPAASALCASRALIDLIVLLQAAHRLHSIERDAMAALGRDPGPAVEQQLAELIRGRYAPLVDASNLSLKANTAEELLAVEVPDALLDLKDGELRASWMLDFFHSITGPAFVRMQAY